ncbi:MAG TPA: hypothetical protein PLN54_06985 [Flavobacteriales bacterium]|nr:hypothetical protein [Flavobacteriales bacterium]
MAIRKFHSRRVWHNTRVMLWLAPVMLLAGVITVSLLNTFAVLVTIAGICLVGTVVALVRDVRKRFVYILDSNGLHLEHDKEAEYIAMSDVVDASLIDRAAAREYIRARSVGMDKAAARERYRNFVRFCSVDIGQTSLTLGLGRSLIDRLPEARHDLLLMRLRDGSEMLLSPDYNQEMVTALSRLARNNKDREGRS